MWAPRKRSNRGKRVLGEPFKEGQLVAFDRRGNQGNDGKDGGGGLHKGVDLSLGFGWQLTRLKPGPAAQKQGMRIKQSHPDMAILRKTWWSRETKMRPVK